VAACVLLIAGITTAAKDKPKEEAYAVIAGTVFQDSGYSLRGAEVSLDPDPTVNPKPKLKIRRMTASARGEFAFRVPPGPMKYTVRAKAARFQPEEKTISVAGDERLDVFFTLKPEAGK
jgi:hypothetical protein